MEIQRFEDAAGFPYPVLSQSRDKLLLNQPTNMKLETISPSIVHWASHDLNTNYKNYWIFH